jgi:hypothetical protein
MTASPGREVDGNLLRGAAPGSALTRADTQDARRQDLGDLVEALGGRHEVGIEGVRHVCNGMKLRLFTCPPKLADEQNKSRGDKCLAKQSENKSSSNC